MKNAHNVPSWLTSGGEPVAVEKIDDYTVKFIFAEPNGLFQNLATPPVRHHKLAQALLLSQFHPDTAEDIDGLIAENNATDWVNLMELKCGGVSGTPYEARWYNADLPTLMAWDITKSYLDNSTQLVAERNPYYWKVDTAGRQLPYIDRVVYDILEDREVLLLKVLNGEIDMMSRHFNTNDNKAVLADSMEAGEFNFFQTVESGNTTGFMFNLTHK
ncbi:MAG: ABC transporter substrate-binding protein [Caldilineaceae bacterium]